jgi:hypothetical protein
MYKIENLTFGNGIGDREIKDKIQILRKEENDTFISEQVPKKAQWDEIINLCEKYLNVSKDLYILNRMCEAITALYGISGIRLCIDIINKFLSDPKGYLPTSEETRENYFHWINNRLPDYIYKNLAVEKVIQGKQKLQDEEINILYECIEKAKKFFFYSEIFEKKILQLASVLQKS